MSIRISLFVTLAAIVLQPSLGWAEKAPVRVTLEKSKFETIGTQRGVTVYKHRKAKNVRVGAVGRIPAPPADVQRAVLDYEGQLGKIARLSESRVLERKGSSLLVYQRLNLPIIDDRDFTLRVKRGKDGAKRWVSYWAVKRGGPAKRDGVVRVTHHQGAWEMRPTAGGKHTLVRFETTIDMAGSVPRILLRTGAGKELPDLFASICQLSVPAEEQDQCG